MFKIQTWHRDQFWEWCGQNNIICEYMGTSSGDPTNPFSRTALDTWYIGSEDDRMLAILRDLPHKVITPKQIVEPAKRWCEEQVGERWCATQNRNGKWCVFWAGTRSKNPGTYEWFFEDDKDATLFALRWT